MCHVLHGRCGVCPVPRLREASAVFRGRSHTPSSLFKIGEKTEGEGEVDHDSSAYPVLYCTVPGNRTGTYSTRVSTQTSTAPPQTHVRYEYSSSIRVQTAGAGFSFITGVPSRVSLGVMKLSNIENTPPSVSARDNLVKLL